MTLPFTEWLRDAYGPVADRVPLERVFEVMVCRIEEAIERDCVDPIRAVSNQGSPRSRSSTKAMLLHLGLTTGQARIVQRLMAGSAGGWPGLLLHYLTGTTSFAIDERRYITRQLRDFQAYAICRCAA